MPPLTSVSPDWYLLGVSPKWAPTLRDLRNRAGSSTAEVKVTATSAPTPGTPISRRQAVSSRTIASTARCRTWYSARSASRARSIGSAPPSRIGWVSAPQRPARTQHRLAPPLQQRLARDQLADPRREPALAHLAQLQPEPAQ